MRKILISGIVGGIVVFIWGVISHVVLPIGEAGIRTIPNEDVVIRAMKETIHEPGLYFFPGLDMSREPTSAEQQAWEAKYRAGPTGILVYHPRGEQPLSPRQLITELVSNVMGALIAAFLLSLTATSFGVRALFVALLGLFCWLSISVSYWNWYRFPTAFIAAEGIDQIVGWLLAGLTMAAILKDRKS